MNLTNITNRLLAKGMGMRPIKAEIEALIALTREQLTHERIDSAQRQLDRLGERIARIELRLIRMNGVCCIDGPKPKFPLLDDPHATPRSRTTILQSRLDYTIDRLARIERLFGV
jgi:hypothetical protein